MTPVRRRPGQALRVEVMRVGRVLSFLGHYIRLLLRANMTVARQIVARRPRLAPAIVEVRLRARTPLEMAAVGHLINLTPGTLVLDVRHNPPALFVHGMQAADPAAFRRDLCDLEGRFLQAVRQQEGEKR